MNDFRPGGRRRLDRVLDPALLDHLPDSDLAELRTVADDAAREEAELSYVRRLLQGRLDQVRDEVERRRASSAAPPRVRTDDELVEMLSGVLAEPRTEGTGAGRYVDVEADVDLERRRAAELAAADVRLSDPSALDDAGLEAARARLAELEAKVSSTRHDVQRVVDAVAAELAARVERGQSAS